MSIDKDRFALPDRLPAALEGRKLFDVYEEGSSWFLYLTTVAKHCTGCDAVTAWSTCCTDSMSRACACNVCEGTQSRTTLSPFTATMSEQELRAVLAGAAGPDTDAAATG